MRAGFGISDITPPLGVELAGYGYYLERKCDSVRDPLHARAVILENEEGRQAIVSCELLGLSQEIADAVIAHAAALSCSRDRVMIVSVHTHTGPVVKYHLGCGEVDPAYVAALGEKICAALDRADRDMDQVASLSFVQAEVPGDYIYNRAAEDGPVDRNARGFWIRREKSAPILLASAACHGVFLKCVSCVSADFSGEIHRIFADQGVQSIYLNGLCGDIDPWQSSEQRMKEYAKKAAEVLGGESRSLPLTLSGVRLPFTLRLQTYEKEGITAAASQAVQKNGGENAPASKVARAWEKEMLSRFDSLKGEEAGDAALCVLGGIPILALPFEGYTGIGVDFRRLIGSEEALVLGCAEQLRGYLPTRDDFERRSYAALESPFLYRRQPPLPGEAERLAEQLAVGYQAFVSARQCS